MSTQPKILVTGGAGFIGSHICVELLNAGYSVVILDNLVNASHKVVDRIREIALGSDATNNRLVFHEVDLLNLTATEGVFAAHTDIHAVIHLAGLKAVGESTQKPTLYFHNNLTGSLHLLMTMRKFNVSRLLFSSTATVYGEPAKMPITEDMPTDAKSPYARTKLMVEDIMRDEFKANPDYWKFGILRYFNPVGAHKSGRLGEDPNGIPNNLMPFITKIAIGKLKELSVFGNDYPTRDGTGVRDYIHVVDLAEGHIAALRKLEETNSFTYNLGTGRGATVLEIVVAFSKASGKEIPYKIVGRRTGDVPVLEADPTKANQELGWVAKRGVEEMCADSWNWQQKNPDGYNTV